MITTQEVMGTIVGLDMRDDVAPPVVDAFFAWLHEVDARFSTYKPSSEINRLSRGELTLADVSDDVHEVLDLCGEMFARSDGVFDVWGHRADGALDPSALVKGWSLERGAAMLRGAGARNFCINGGGDVIAAGEPEPARAWRIGIRHPEDASSMAAIVDIRDLAVATSGSYERGGHIIDPATGHAASDLLSVSVVGPDMTLADAYATAAFAMGARGPRWVAALDGYEVFAITADRRTYFTDGFEAMRVRGDA